MIFNDVLNSIDRGKQGMNQGLPMGFDRLIEFLPNIQQSTYYLVGAETGVGKTSFVDDVFLYNPFQWVKNNPGKFKMRVIYFSFEIEKKMKIAKAICRQLYKEFGILTDINYILSRGKNRVSQEIFDKVTTFKDHFEELEDVLEIWDMPENPTGIYRYLKTVAEEQGKIITKEVDIKGQKVKIFDKYIPHDPNLFTIVVIDHIKLAKRESGLSTKDNIDKLSNYMIRLRNNFGFIPVVVQQFNRDISSTDRAKLNKLTPQLSDFKDSGDTQQDANVILSLFSPSRYEIEEYAGYNVKTLKDSFRSLHILKNRDGAADKRLGLFYNGKVGMFSELPPAKDLTKTEYIALLKSIM